MSRSTRLAARLLDEADQTSDWHFTTRLTGKQVDVTNYYKGADYTEATAELTIEWEVDFEVRDWGIKEITPNVTKVTGTIQITHPDTEAVLESIPVSWPKEPDAQQLQTLNHGAAPPTAETSVKDWASYYGSAQHNWQVVTEAFHKAGSSFSLAVAEAAIDVGESWITVRF